MNRIGIANFSRQQLVADYCTDCGHQFDNGDTTVTTNVGFICGECADYYGFTTEERYV